MLEPDAYTVFGGHDGCIWTPFPVTALSGRRAKFNLCCSAQHDSLRLSESYPPGVGLRVTVGLTWGSALHCIALHCIVECFWFDSVRWSADTCHLV